MQRTKRLTRKIAELFHETPSLKSVAKTSNVSATTVCRILDSIHYSCPPLKEAVSIN
ncbi:transposase family protein [Ruminococcus sp. AF17-22AC]|uniref:transposase family protein n=1 Tax=Ruminococcus sp. AF17-22AC TaxID=2292248 RepID=UPI00336BB778